MKLFLNIPCWGTHKTSQGFFFVNLKNFIVPYEELKNFYFKADYNVKWTKYGIKGTIIQYNTCVCVCVWGTIDLGYVKVILGLRLCIP